MAKKSFIGSRSLRPQLFIAFCLMSIIPILSLCNFIFPSIFRHGDAGIIVVTAIVLALSGFFLIKRIIDSIIRLNSEMKSIASGELSRQICVKGDDEIGEMSFAVNQLTSHIKDNMDELKIYGERTKDINAKINKQLVALSGVLQIGNFISSKTSLKDIFDTTISRIAQITGSSMAFILLESENRLGIAAQFGLAADAITAIQLQSNEYVLNSIRNIKIAVRISEPNSSSPNGDLLKILNAKNIAIHPLFVCGKPEGFLGIASNAQGGYSEDDAELLDVFTKQLAVAVENDYLSKKVDDLEVKDSLTGLFNRRYIADRLEEEILRSISHQRPCAFIVLKIMGLRETKEKSGQMVVEDMLRRCAEILKSSLSEFDRVGRIEYDEFGLVFPEKNKIRAEALAKQLKHKVEEALDVSHAEKKYGVSVVVVENPIDGSDAAALMEKAKRLLG